MNDRLYANLSTINSVHYVRRKIKAKLLLRLMESIKKSDSVPSGRTERLSKSYDDRVRFPVALDIIASLKVFTNFQV